MLSRMQKNKNSTMERRDKVDKQTAFQEFKQLDIAKEHEETIMKCRQDLRERREELKVKTA
jgi:hypothetical protein